MIEATNEQLADNAIIDHALDVLVDEFGPGALETYIGRTWLGKNAETITNRFAQLQSLHIVPSYTETYEKFAELKY